MNDPMNSPMTIHAIQQLYRSGKQSPRSYLTDCWTMAQQDTHHAWIALISEAQLQEYLGWLETQIPDDLPLYGIPFAIKDNIDLAALPTTAGCPAFSYQPEQSAFVVQQLMAAGAIPLGKTNLDQFATGLVGVRSPYDACRNAINPDYISGGSSAGSAVAVALGYVAFSLGTDTAGSGRVPAAFNNLVGMKGSKGLVSCRGVVPACRSLDCVTVFAHTSADIAQIWPIASQFDPADAFARPAQAAAVLPARFRFGVPSADVLQFFGDSAAETCFQQAIQRLQQLGGIPVPINLQPFLDAATLLYDGPWVAERLAAIEEFFLRDQNKCLPVIQTIIGGARNKTAVQAYQALYRLQELKRLADAELAKVDLIVTPTAGTTFTIADVEADPIRLNSQLGYYTNFMNLLDYSAIALPAGWRTDGLKQGLPFGITLFAQTFQDDRLLALGQRWQATDDDQSVLVAVCGAHLAGLPLNHQLTERRGRCVSVTKTAKAYRMYALAGGPPFRPGLIRDDEQGQEIDIEVWSLPMTEFGSFVAGIPAPLGIGKLELVDGSWVCGFICESAGLSGATEITALGGWRAYLAATK